jgi:hypothetical protein
LWTIGSQCGNIAKIYYKKTLVGKLQVSFWRWKAANIKKLYNIEKLEVLALQQNDSRLLTKSNPIS